ncbi:MAG: iron-containing alcohol dehydrogenase [Lachnospiraceae bacterium]|nr:iron-containing alcohol dehydrogenase [Lachnospiraceae bacterium]
MAYKFSVAGQAVIGSNALKLSETAMKRLGKKALIVTGKIVTKTGLVKILTGCLDGWGIKYEVFNDIIGEPNDKMIEAGVKIYKDTCCDFVIGIGGGSPLDSAKAISAMTVLEGKISDYLGKELVGDFPPIALIPTTAGTGSETTKISVITDSEKEIKMLLLGDSILPDLAIVDPEFTKTSPKSITAATGMDALTHAVESYIAKGANPITDMFALSAIKRIFKYLPIAYKNGNDNKAREEMSMAAFEAGICINNASTTLVHGMSRPIGALFHVPHGISNAMLINECMKYVFDGCYVKFADIARAMGAADEGASDEEAAGIFLKELDDICKKCEIPTLAEYGIDKKEFDAAIEKMSKDAMDSGSPSKVIREVTREDLVIIYNKLW